MIKAFEKISTIPNITEDPKQFKVEESREALVAVLRVALGKPKKNNFEQCLKYIQCGESCEKALREFAQKKHGRKYAWKLLHEMYASDDSKPITPECSKELFNVCGLSIEINSIEQCGKLKNEIVEKKKGIWEEKEKIKALRKKLIDSFEKLINSENASKFNTMFFILYCFKANGLSNYVQVVNLFFVKKIEKFISNSGQKFQLVDTYGDFVFSILTLEDLEELVNFANGKLK